MGVATLAAGLGALSSQAVASAGDLAGAAIVTNAPSFPAVANPAAATAAVVTVVGVAGQRVRLTKIAATFTTAAPAAPVALTVADGAVTENYIVAAAIGTTAVVEPTGGVAYATGATVTVTLASGGGASVAALAIARVIG